MAADVREYISEMQATRSQVLGQTMNLSVAKAINSGNAISVYWRTGGAEGRFHLNVKQAGLLGNQLVQLANGEMKATREADRETDNQD